MRSVSISITDNCISDRNCRDLCHEKNTTRRQDLSYLGCIRMCGTYSFSSMVRILGANLVKHVLACDQSLTEMQLLIWTISGIKSSGK